MILEIFSVYDSKMEAFLPPFFQLKQDQAKRVFSNAANDKQHQFGANPADYTLFHIGTFDDAKGKINSIHTPHSLGIAQEFVVQNNLPKQTELHLANAE